METGREHSLCSFLGHRMFRLSFPKLCRLRVGICYLCVCFQTVLFGGSESNRFFSSPLLCSWLSTGRGRLTPTRRRNRRRRRKRSRRTSREPSLRGGRRSSRISLPEEDRRARAQRGMHLKKKGTETLPPRSSPSPGRCGAERPSSTTRPTP